MSKQILSDCKIIFNHHLNDSYYLIRIELPSNDGKYEFVPGCFVQIAPCCSNAFLRRPISVCNYSMEHNTLDLLIQKVGKVTSDLFDIHEGAMINILGPLGQGFNTLPDFIGDHPLLIGGGVGLAPMLMLAKAIHAQGGQATLISGARTADLIVLQDEIKAYADLHITTDDGTLGHKGNVLQHPIISDPSRFTSVFTCGPRPMMKAVALWAIKHGIEGQASLENRMACGIGACLCCVEDIKDKGNLCVCTDGPVFNFTEIKW